MNAERLAERYLDAVRVRDFEKAAAYLTAGSAGYEFEGPGAPVAGADYTILSSSRSGGAWTVECHALLRLRSCALAERWFALYVSGEGDGMRIDLARSEGSTRALSSRRVIEMNERASEAGAGGNLPLMHALLARAEAISAESDLGLSGLGLDPGEPPVEVEPASDDDTFDEPAPAEPEPEPEPDREFFLELTAKYWRARLAGDASARETRSPSHASGFDVSRAESIWDSVSAFHEALGDPGEWPGAVSVRTLVECSRGPFVVLTAFLKEGSIWRVDRNASLNATAHWWLRLYSDMHPFHPEKSPRASAMRFWHWTQMHSFPRAMDYAFAEGAAPKIPGIGRGEVWEFFFYLDQKVDAEAGKAMVRVLINASNLVRIVHTPLILRGDEWLVDLPRVLRQLPAAE